MIEISAFELIVAIIGSASAFGAFMYMVVRNMFKDQNDHLKEQIKELLSANRKYSIETTEMKLNTLYEVLEISNAMVIQLPRKHKIKILGSYSKPKKQEDIEKMRDTSFGMNLSELVKFDDMPKYIFLKSTDNESQIHVLAKGFKVEEIRV